MKGLMTCLVAGSQYLLHPDKLGTIQETINSDALIPVTLLETSEIFGNVDETLEKFGRRDDVFVSEFGFVLIEKPGGANSSTGSAMSLQEQHGDAADRRRKIYHLDEAVSLMAGEMARLPSGPYFLFGPNLYQAWKLYDDEADAFALGVIPENATQTAGFQSLNSLSQSGSHKAIAVPSRLYHPHPSPEKPLSGMRMAIPDSMSLKGVPTSLSSRSWQSLYQSPADTTAAFAQRLLDQGALIVGKTKSSQFASAAEWVDEREPWNPRGDGYQHSLGGAAGAAAAMATYKWLTLAFGFDGFGGVTEPAAAHGLFSLRTTPETAPLAGSQTSATSYDSVGLVSRNLPELSRIATAVLSQSGLTPNLDLPKRLVYPQDIADVESSEEDRRLVSRFLRVLESSLGLTAEKVNVSIAWAESPPPEAKGQALQEYVKDSAFRSFCYEFYHQYDEFRKTYQNKFHIAPYTEASVKYRWETGKRVSKQEYDEYRLRIDVFRKWFQTNIMDANSSRDAWTAVAMPFHSQAPVYRDEPMPAPSAPSGIPPELLPSILQAPQVLVPLAQLPYESRISGRKEDYAVYGSVMGPRGSDVAALDMVQAALDKAHWRMRVDFGRLAFPEGYAPPEVGSGSVQDVETQAALGDL
ncbi:hypothetical protein CDD83_5918 [Cordyceps sp. RAO-2017]|nr:hypothetical protein CDD83_5918 [Cordyceps sp. RAO-2017]